MSLERASPIERFFGASFLPSSCFDTDSTTESRIRDVEATFLLVSKPTHQDVATLKGRDDR